MSNARRRVNPGQGVTGRMAGGFWTGLTHGGLVGAGVLAALALVLPLPDDAATMRNDSPAAPVSAPATSAATSADAAPDASSAGGSATPRAAAVDLPVGSEFARGGDIAPVLPAPLSRSPARQGQAEAPAVSAPPAEPAPVAVTTDAIRPDADRQGAPATPAAPDAVEGVELFRPAATQRPAFMQADSPGSPVADAPPPSGPNQDSPPPAGSNPGSPDPDPAAAPIDSGGMTAPILDLSLPPALSDLRTGPTD